MKKIFLFIFLFLSVNSYGKIIDGIAAIVNNDIITISDLNLALAPFKEQLKHANIPKEKKLKELERAKEQILDNLINNKLIEQKAKEMNYVVTEKDVDNVIKYLQYFDTVPARVLVLMLNIVGTESGPPLNEIRNVVKKLRYLGVKEVYYGGGVRNIEDVYNLVMCGIDGVIVGTALHKGRITVAEIEV